MRILSDCANHVSATAMNAAEAAWRRLSVEAANVIDVLRRQFDSTKEPYSCAS